MLRFHPIKNGGGLYVYIDIPHQNLHNINLVFFVEFLQFFSRYCCIFRKFFLFREIFAKFRGKKNRICLERKFWLTILVAFVTICPPPFILVCLSVCSEQLSLIAEMNLICSTNRILRRLHREPRLKYINFIFEEKSLNLRLKQGFPQSMRLKRRPDVPVSRN